MTCYGVSVGVIPRHRPTNTVLLIQRANGPQRGTWAAPAGHWEHPETLRETAIREASEEAGLFLSRSTLGPPVGYWHHMEDVCSRGTKYHDWTLYRAWVLSQDVTLSRDEVLDAQWVPVAELFDWNLEPVMRRMLVTVFNRNRCDLETGYHADPHIDCFLR